MTEDKFKTVLQPFLPEPSLDHCYDLWKNYGFILKVKGKRASKLGDYRYDPHRQQHIISVNNDLNPYSFLITYIHEVAHLVTFKEYKRKVKPHGEEWKRNFKQLMLPILNHDVFPDSVLRRLAHYLRNPKASSCNDHQLMSALRDHDDSCNGAPTLHEIPSGSLFKFRNRIFKREVLKRTRYVCCEVSTQKKYLISKMAEVEPVEG